MRKRNGIAVAACALLVVVNASVSADVLRETFDTDASGAAVGAAYPLFTQSGSGSGVVEISGGVLLMSDAANNQVIFSTAGDASVTRITALVGKTAAGGSQNTGLIVGPNNFVFHPGFGAPAGAFRIEGPGGTGNTDMGYIPDANVMHLMTVDINPLTGQHDIRVVNASNPSQVFSTSFTNLGAIGGPIGARRAGANSGGDTTLHDNLTVTSGNTLFYESFDLDTVGPTQTGIAYDRFTTNVAFDTDVINGVVELGGENTMTIAGYSQGIRITADVGAVSSNGNYNVGLSVGDNRIVFHPGFGGGAFRVEDTGGFGNQNMGFTPANGSLHHLEIVQHTNGLFQATLTDGDNPNNVYKAEFTNLASVGGLIGLTRAGPGADGLYDNLRVDVLDAWTATIGAANPIHWWRMDEPTGRPAYDVIGGLDGVDVAGVTRGVAGLQGGAAAFNGGNAVIDFAGTTLVAGDWSAEFILKKTGNGRAQHLLSGANYSLRLEQWDGTSQLGFTELGIADYLFAPAAFAPLDAWAHIVYVADQGANTTEVYVNGVLVGTVNAYITLPLDRLGNVANGPDAIIDEVVVYDRNLSAFEVRQHYYDAQIPTPSALLSGLGLMIAAAARRRRR